MTSLGCRPFVFKLAVLETIMMNTALWTPVVVAIVFALLRLLIPLKKHLPPTSLPAEELDRTYRKWDIASSVPVIVFGGLSAYLWFLVLHAIAGLILLRPLNSIYFIIPEDAYWAIPALFLGIISSGPPSVLLYKWLLGNSYSAYEAYSLMRVGFDAWAVVKGFAVLFVLLTVGFILGAINYTTIFDQEGITTKRLWGRGGGFHSYSSIESIRSERYITAPNGNRVFKPHHVIEFTDGARWTTLDGLRTPRPLEDIKIMQFVAQKSGRQFDE